MTPHPNTPYPRTCEFLEDLGIDPSSIPEGSITIHGYDTFDLNAKGERIYRDFEIVRTRMEWPNPLVGMTVFTLIQMDRRRGRLRGLAT
jgi:hypothetical protein